MNQDKLFNEFQKFIKGRELNSEDEFEEIFEEFMKAQGMPPIPDYNEYAEDVYEYLELAENATSKKEALKYAKKAMETDPTCLEAKAMVAELTATGPEKLLDKYEELLQEEKDCLKDAGYYEEDSIGDFWLIYETRPFMQLYGGYIRLLVDCGMMRKAIVECKEMLRLCENDNLAFRYVLMHIYAHLEDVDSALELFDKYEKCNSTMFLLPLSILYYKTGNLKESAKYLKLLKNSNKDTMEFFRLIVNQDLYALNEDMFSMGYRPYTIDEFMIAFQENSYLYLTSPMYFKWALKKLKSMK